ncbi:hypothetical protein [Alloyangia pacifica]|uniref:Alpha/beta hydrolase n=1 Tax=Alloyangia pacifica TaxID=311180 RepID=A0A1I6RM36_9RHOB|nr:hypothetical protein [Alloyangia pacifica]SDI68916.1 hypothetical protein SAMN04488245_1226 [Alloyangia pacifica]SFS65660.1 hypothetical protein SAMN04488050_103190 [Alloyangia pacifica]
MQVLYEDEATKVAARQGVNDETSGSILLSFTGIGHGMGGLDVQRPEFFGAGRAFDNIIFITDKRRSWGNALDFGVIADVLSPFVAGREVYSIGNSMGGFISIISTRYIDTKISIAFVPQYSVSPDRVPWEKRWRDYTASIQTYRFECVEGYFAESTKYFIFSGAIGDDYRHARLFPIGDNIFHYAFHDMVHEVAADFKRRNVLDAAVQSCFREDARMDLGLSYERLSPR